MVQFLKIEYGKQGCKCNLANNKRNEDKKMMMNKMAIIKLNSVTIKALDTKVICNNITLYNLAGRIQHRLTQYDIVTVEYNNIENDCMQRLDFYSDDLHNETEDIIAILATQFCNCKQYITDELLREYVLLNMYRNQCQHLDVITNMTLDIHFGPYTASVDFQFHPSGLIKAYYEPKNKTIEHINLYTILNYIYMNMVEYNLM